MAAGSVPLKPMGCTPDAWLIDNVSKWGASHGDAGIMHNYLDWGKSQLNFQNPKQRHTPHPRCIFNMHQIWERISLQRHFLNIMFLKHLQIPNAEEVSISEGCRGMRLLVMLCQIWIYSALQLWCAYTHAMTGEVKQTLNTSLDCTFIQHYQIDLIHMAQISDLNNHKISIRPLIFLPFKHHLLSHGWRCAMSQLYLHSSGWR